MRTLVALVVLFALSACATRENAPRSSAEQHGFEIARTNCSSCHAVGPSGDSTAPEAPPFRRLSEHYRIDDLEEALAEGINVGHPAMPHFEFPPEDIDALVSYLESIQDSPGRGSARD